MTQQTTAAPPRSPWWPWPSTGPPAWLPAGSSASSAFELPALGGTVFELPWRLAALAAASTATTMRLLETTAITGAENASRFAQAFGTGRLPQPVAWFPPPVRFDGLLSTPVATTQAPDPADTVEESSSAAAPIAAIDPPPAPDPAKTDEPAAPPAEPDRSKQVRPKSNRSKSGRSKPDPSPKSLHADDLPIPAWDSLTLGSIRARLRSLDLAQLRVLHEYEEQHGARVGILTMLENRVTKLEQERPAPTKKGQRARRKS